MSEFNVELADVVAGDEYVYGFRNFLKAFNDGFAILELAEHLPLAKLRGGLPKAGYIVEDDESFQAYAVDQHRCETGERRVFLRVARDQSAENNAAVKIHPLKNGAHDFATNIFKIYVDALRCSRSEMLFPIGVFVVDGGGETKVLGDPLPRNVVSETNGIAEIF